MKPLLVQVLQQITPLPHKEIPELLVLLQDKLPFSYQVQLGGSTAKKTDILPAHDCDIFVVFEKEKIDNIHISEWTQQLLSSCKELGNITRVHGSRDYFQCVYKQIRVEIVPVVHLNEHTTNSTDYSIHHVAWFKEQSQRVVEGQPLYNHVRLLKQFCKAHYCYGAESFMHGFSGHVLEILTVFYGGFEHVLEAVTTWDTFPLYINIHDKHINQTTDNTQQHKQDGKHVDVTKQLSKHQLHSLSDNHPLWLVDPIYAKRNAAAALSLKVLQRFQYYAKAYLKNPSIDFFSVRIPWEYPSEQTVVCDFVVEGGNPDIQGTKVYKKTQKIIYALQEHGFEIHDWLFYWNKKDNAQLFMHVIEHKIPKQYVHKGPPLHEQEACVAFQKKYNDCFTQDGVLCCYKIRTFTSIYDALKVLQSKT
ncbi:MAG: hypothetical protein ACMXYC_00435 [Candidatus Woesearchaeota archaeon]